MTARWSGRISASLARLHPPLKVFRHGTANRDIVQNGWRAFADHDADRISAFFTEDAEWMAPQATPPLPPLDVPSHRVGRKAFAHVIADDFPRLFARGVTI